MLLSVGKFEYRFRMEKKWVILSGVLVVAVFAAGFMFRKSADLPSSPSAAGVTYYYGEECPHCKDVLNFIEENHISEKVSFTKKETWNDRENAKELMARAKTCGIPEKQVGVPFLYAEGKCYIGSPDVEGYFREKAGISAGETLKD